jgi:HD-GYP domain-containing protein (c-di-GMP phosphodiesterase class II)
MPVLLTVDQLESGMTLVRNISNEHTTLLPHGKRITGADIAALKRIMPDRLIQISDPVLDEYVEFEDDSADREISQQIRGKVQGIAHKVSQSLRDSTTLTEENIDGIQEIIDEIVKSLQENPTTIAIMDQIGGADSYLQEHTSNVFYLSLVIGNTLRNYIQRERERLSAAKVVKSGLKITPLGTAAMFCDIGMIPIENLYKKKTPLTMEEIEQIRAHPVIGAKMLPDNMDPMVKLAIRCHHENMDGSGYPEGLEGSCINIFSRILRVADAYSAATSKTIYSKAKAPILVLHEMLTEPYKSYSDPAILKVFSSIVQPLPIGAKITLNTGQTAVVVAHNPQDPFKPKLVIAFDEFGDPQTQDQLEPPFLLSERDELQMTAFGKQDLSFFAIAPSPFRTIQKSKNSMSKRPKRVNASSKRSSIWSILDGLLRLRLAASVKLGLPRVGLRFTWLPALSSLGQNKT